MFAIQCVNQYGNKPRPYMTGGIRADGIAEGTTDPALAAKFNTADEAYAMLDSMTPGRGVSRYNCEAVAIN